jgi:hypothetical protein
MVVNFTGYFHKVEHKKRFLSHPLFFIGFSFEIDPEYLIKKAFHFSLSPFKLDPALFYSAHFRVSNMSISFPFWS